MKRRKSIDVVVGGQFGDEGKGQICAHLTHEQMLLGEPYGFAVRVGGSNAEHRFATPDNKRHTGRVLPVAGWVDPHLKMILGAGHMIKLSSLFSEIDELEGIYGKQRGRIFIDPQAGIIDSKHVEDGKRTSWRGSTHQGNGQAVAHKVLRDGKFTLAKDYPELSEYVYSDAAELISDLMQNGETGLLEGSQGALLSLNHGYYPYCTSKDVTPAALLAEAGISTDRVRHTWSVYRTIPMRVPGNSGPSDGQELDWDDLQQVIGKKIPLDAQLQTDSGNRERVFMWSWKEFRKSLALIGPTHMALTFADWWPTPLMGGASPNDHINEMERIADCPVGIVRDGPNWNCHYNLPRK